MNHINSSDYMYRLFFQTLAAAQRTVYFSGQKVLSACVCTHPRPQSLRYIHITQNTNVNLAQQRKLSNRRQ